MNDPSKAVTVNLSSLLSLKAELLRKQTEIKLAKATKASEEEFAVKAKKDTNENIKNKKKHAKELSHNEDAIVYETEDLAQLEKSRRVLEAKSKFYDRMSRSGGTLNSDDNCLVMFNRKRQEENSLQEHRLKTSMSKANSDNESEDEENGITEDEDEDWVEFTDCLGRTRKCLRKELEDIKRRDKELYESMPERLDQTKANWMINTKITQYNNKANSVIADDGEDNTEKFTIGPKITESIFSENMSTMTKLEEQRINWERTEQKNLDKTEVHYQDVFFDEARLHGVGYYAFSTDEEERKKQQQQLIRTREATKAEQVKYQAMREKRDRLIADRVFVAKNRIRARDGLPPLSREEFDNEYNKPKAKEMAKKKEELEKKKNAEKLEREREQTEAELKKLRKDYVRPWDQDKPGVANVEKKTNEEEDWKYKPERLPMSQAEWNEKQRAVRNPEFAPPPTDVPESKRTNFFSISEMTLTPANEFIPFQSTKRDKAKSSNFTKHHYTAIANDATEGRSYTGGAAIPPPADLDTNCALSNDAKRQKTNHDLERTIEAGLRFLREKSDKGQPTGTKLSWSAKANY